jgi:toxin-antitoxin system PIN domain toxin
LTISQSSPSRWKAHLIDANPLLYAYHPPAEQYARSRAWLEAVLSGPDLVRFAWLTLWAFLKILTNPRVYDRTLFAPEAEAAVASWLAQPAADIVEPGERHWDILRGLMLEGQTTGPLIMDAVLAAIALEHGATLCTTDRDFSRFPGIKWMNPLATSG